MMKKENVHSVKILSVEIRMQTVCLNLNVAHNGYSDVSDNETIPTEVKLTLQQSN